MLVFKWLEKMLLSWLSLQQRIDDRHFDFVFTFITERR